MQRARTFFYVSAGICLLAFAFHVGATTATAQAPGNPVVGIASFDIGCLWAITANGDVYQWGCGGPATIHYWNNIFGGAPTPARASSFGAVKARYR